MDIVISDLTVLWISRFDYLSHWVLEPHAHDDFYQLIYCVEGSCVLSLPTGEISVNSPAAFFLPPGLRHGLSGISAHGLKTLDTKFSIKESGFSAECNKIPYILNNPPKDIAVLLEKTLAEGNQKKSFFREYCQIMLAQILIELIRLGCAEDQPTNAPQLLVPDKELTGISLRVFHFIEKNYAKNPSAKDFEAALSYSYRYLSKKFEADTGMSPVEFVKSYRITQAQKLLQYCDNEIKEVCELVGFNNVHQFTRAFKDVIGMPPAQWRGKVRSGIREDIIINSDFKNTLHIREKLQ